jgi:hypothetical protein
LLALRDRERRRRRRPSRRGGRPRDNRPQHWRRHRQQFEQQPIAPSRQGKKAMTGYFSPEMSFAMHMTARKNGMSLQDAMAEAFNDWLRKMGESPVGK